MTQFRVLTMKKDAKKNVRSSEVYENKPEDFAHEVQVSACYVEVQGKLLVLELSSEEEEVGFWAVPAGKVEKNENPLHAAIRELFEETGIEIEKPASLKSLGSLYIRKPEIDYIYHFYKISLNTIPTIHLSTEHQSYRWVTITEMKKMPLMKGAKEALEYYCKRSISL